MSIEEAKAEVARLDAELRAAKKRLRELEDATDSWLGKDAMTVVWRNGERVQQRCRVVARDRNGWGYSVALYKKNGDPYAATQWAAPNELSPVPEEEQ